MNTASGDGSPASASGARPVTTRSPGTPSRPALRATRAARPVSASTAVVAQVGCARIHSMPTEPAPAPTSHRCCPGPGASRASADARRSRRVSWPSFSNASSGSPATRPRAGGPASSSASTFRAGASPGGEASQSSAVPDSRDSRSVPRSPSTVITLRPYPAPASSAATAAGVAASEDSTSTR